MKFTIFVDADSCPRPVKNHILQYSKNHSIPLVFAANREIPVEENLLPSEFIMKICDKTEGAADDFIVSSSKEGDVVITRDIPLADRLLQKKVTVMNDRGFLFTQDNIIDKLNERRFSLNLADLGLEPKKKSFYSEKEFKKFADCFERTVSQRILE